MINSNDVLKIASLSKLKIEEKQIIPFTEQMNQILSFINKLSTLDTTQVEPTAHAVEINSPLREDTPRSSNIQEAVFEQAPKQEEQLFVVPKVIG